MAGQKFRWHGLSVMDAKGRLSVPSGFRQVIEARVGGREILMSRHATMPCIVCYDGLYEQERDEAHKEQKTIELNRGDDRSSEIRQRAIYSSSVPVNWDPSGRVSLPDYLKKSANIGKSGLFVGMGDHFEIWDVQTLYDHETAGLRDLAAEFLEQAAAA